MATKVVEIELNKFATLNLAELDLSKYGALQILVRQAGKPLGYCWIKLTETATPPPPDEIALQTAYQLNTPIMLDMLRKDLLSHNGLPQPYLPHVTVAICTRGRKDSLFRTLESLAKLDYPADKLEILIVENAPEGEATRRQVEAMTGVRYTTEPRPGLSWARNRAALEARHEIVAFIDDDVEIDSGWLKAIVHPFAEPSVMCVTGLVAPARQDTPSQELFEAFGGLGKGFMYKHINMAWQRTATFFPLGTGNFGAGANMAFRTAVIKELGGFDVAFGNGVPNNGHNDNELFYRLIRAGYGLVYNPDALVWHYHREDMKSLYYQINGYGHGTASFLLKTFISDPPMRRDTLVFWLYYRLLNAHLLKVLKARGLERKMRLVYFQGFLTGPFKYYQSLQIKKKTIARYGKAGWESKSD
ncbi:MAG: glycosyltransferase [Chloroflexi bacterium]|uniref:Glycosyltransferase n=1 Tax=Candidatus Chlorohelix allophototropha TaxID=3003348 RepID=A0A8T7M736_9CHLR|nr:glycosyltransferase [Chloroflexota bacterium]WJW69833.1 glycosyltransferase [Chloroflexota bacterium L227-S17]